jgi:hydroxyacylglutathione hydrolase
MVLTVHVIPALQDNYIYLLTDPQSNSAAIVDPGEAKPVFDFLNAHDLNLTHIFLTHHHWDHINGIAELKAAFDPEIIGPALNKDQIPDLTRTINEGDKVAFAGTHFDVFEVPGHTMGHVIYFEPNEKILFSGDTLFAMGCGRLFEGSYEDMFTSLQKIKALPKETKIYCGHEYSEHNAHFALTIFPENYAIKERLQKIEAMRARNDHTMGFTLAEELATNPFLIAETIEAFKEYREKRNHF